MAYNKENVVRLYIENDDAEQGVCLEISPNPDSTETSIMLHTPDKKSKDWFGDITIYMDVDECKALGEALVEYATKFEHDNA